MSAHHGPILNGHDPLVGGRNGHPVNGSDPLDVERVRLEAEIAAAEARAASARRRSEQLNAALHEVVLASKAQLAAMEREHEAVLADIRAAAARQVEQIMAEARRRTSSVDPSTGPTSTTHPAADPRPEVTG